MSFLVHWLQQYSCGLRFSGILRSVDNLNIQEQRRPRPRRVYVHEIGFNIKVIIVKNIRMVRCTVHISAKKISCPLEQKKRKPVFNFIYICHLTQILFLYNVRNFHMDQTAYFCLLLGPSSGLLQVYFTYRN